jgi:hypothetical protein
LIVSNWYVRFWSRTHQLIMFIFFIGGGVKRKSPRFLLGSYLCGPRFQRHHPQHKCSGFLETSKITALFFSRKRNVSLFLQKTERMARLSEKFPWVPVEEELPPPKVKVSLSYGLFGIRGAVCDGWVSEGWLVTGGNWSIKWKESVPKYPSPSHWRYITAL